MLLDFFNVSHDVTSTLPSIYYSISTQLSNCKYYVSLNSKHSENNESFLATFQQLSFENLKAKLKQSRLFLSTTLPNQIMIHSNLFFLYVLFQCGCVKKIHSLHRILPCDSCCLVNFKLILSSDMTSSKLIFWILMFDLNDVQSVAT